MRNFLIAKTMSPIKIAGMEQRYDRIPMIDACMRALQATGIIEFSLRAMCSQFFYVTNLNIDCV